jgi:hypothetical protein
MCPRKHEIKTRDLCLIALSGFRLRCLRFACVVSVSYALSEFRIRCLGFVCFFYVSHASVERFLYELWFSPIEQQAVFRSLVYQENELNTMVGSIWNEPHRWCNGKRARLRCGRSGVRTPIGSNERL